MITKDRAEKIEVYMLYNGKENRQTVGMLTNIGDRIEETRDACMSTLLLKIKKRKNRNRIEIQSKM